MGKQKNQKQNQRKNGKDFGNTDCDSLSKQLRQLGFTVKEMLGDGNCLFRALGDQFEGHSRNHIQLRLKVVEYIKANRSEFEPFIEDDVPFDDHVKSLAEPGTYGGNDAIVAFSRIYKVTVVIHQYDSPAWVIHPGSGSSKQSTAKELHISYHNGDHYNSVVRISGNVDISPPQPSQSASANTTPKDTRKSTNNGKANTLPSTKNKKSSTTSTSLPKIDNLQISDDKSEGSDKGSKESQGKKNQSQPPPPKGVKQSRRQILENKKKERKADALQRKRGSAGDATAVPFLNAITSSTPSAVKTVNI